MKSPVSNHKPLLRIELDEGLTAWRCTDSGGHYVKLEDYWKWHHSTSPEDDPKGPAEIESPVSEYDDAVKICPETGSIMTRYRVGRGLDFRVDRSVTGGVWLDAGEWEALKAGDLHRDLHLVFTAPWQKAIRDEEHAAKFDALLREKFGPAFHDKLVEIREELWSHPARAEALAFLETEPEKTE